MLDFANIIQQLEGVSELKSVSEDLQARALPAKMPAAIVYLLSERPSDNENIMGNIRQQVQLSFAVELVVSGKSKDSVNAQLFVLRKKIREALFGLVPADGFNKIQLSNSTLLAIEGGGVRWVDEFKTGYIASSII